MITVHGIYGNARIATDEIENAALEQILNLLNTPIAEHAHIRIMPDVHAGAGCVIGTSMIITDKVVPNLVGVDIGCGVFSQRFDNSGYDIDFEKLDNIIRDNVPHGLQIHETSAFDKTVAPEYSRSNIMDCINAIKAPIDKERAFRSVGSLGGGNHFIEVNKSEIDDEYMLNIHSGSRHLGLEVANYYQKLAVEYCNEKGYNVPKALAFLEGRLFNDYMHDMKLVQKYAHMNRIMIFDIIYYNMLHERMDQIRLYDSFSTVHNYIENNAKLGYILRKGAVAAYENQKLVIPLNMRDGVLLCEGKGNEEWNCTAPHGAGRKYSRKEAKTELSIDDFKHDMEGIYTTCVNNSTLDECPRAYKSFHAENVEEMVDIIKVYKPVYNFKAN